MKPHTAVILSKTKVLTFTKRLLHVDVYLDDCKCTRLATREREKRLVSVQWARKSEKERKRRKKIVANSIVLSSTRQTSIHSFFFELLFRSVLIRTRSYVMIDRIFSLPYWQKNWTADGTSVSFANGINSKTKSEDLIIGLCLCFKIIANLLVSMTFLFKSRWQNLNWLVVLFRQVDALSTSRNVLKCKYNPHTLETVCVKGNIFSFFLFLRLSYTNKKKQMIIIMMIRTRFDELF